MFTFIILFLIIGAALIGIMPFIIIPLGILEQLIISHKEKKTRKIFE